MSTAVDRDIEDGVADLTYRQLRPGIAVTPLRDGLHLRGWRAGVTLEGSRALPALWQLLAQALRTGDHAALAERAPLGSPLRAALNTLIGQLHAHDLLVARTDAASPWLRAVAADPVTAAAAIAAARPRVLAANPAGPAAQAAARALRRAGAEPTVAAWPAGPAGLLLLCDRLPDGELTVDGLAVDGLAEGGLAEGGLAEGGLPNGPGRAPTAVAVLATSDGGFVTAPGSPEQATADAAALTVRLGLAGLDESSAPATLSILLAGAAAQRLLCALAGLPDPAHEGEDQRVLPERPAVLVADAQPLRADYRAWLGPRLLDPDRAAPPPAPTTLTQALHRAAALGDERIGVLAPALPGALPQLPVALVACAQPEGTILAAGARTDLARLDAACRAAEVRLSDGESRVTVGATPAHAWGRALRRAAARDGDGSRPGEPLPAHAWAEHPQARHWWRTLLENTDRACELTIRPVAAEAYHATVRTAGRPPSHAIEATPGDAAAFAALGATAGAISGTLNLPPSHLSLPSGASAVLAVAGLELVGWEDQGWTTGWLADLATREDALHTALHTSLRRADTPHTAPWTPAGPTPDPAPDPAPAPAPATDTQALLAALHNCGFTVLRTPGAAR